MNDGQDTPTETTPTIDDNWFCLRCGHVAQAHLARECGRCLANLHCVTIGLARVGRWESNGVGGFLFAVGDYDTVNRNPVVTTRRGG